MAYLMGSPFVQQFIDANGAPLINGTIEFYIWNTSTPTPIYSDSTGTSAGTSVTLNSIGAPVNGGGTPIALFFDTSVTYKIIRKTAAGAAISPTIGPYTTSVDAANVAYNPGGTGAVATNVQNKIRSYERDLADFMSSSKLSAARSGGTPEISAELALAIAAIQDERGSVEASAFGAMLHIPWGKFYVDAETQIPSYIKLVGVGPHGTIVAATTAIAIFRCIGIWGGLWNMMLSDESGAHLVTGLKLAPADESQQITVTHQDHNTFMNLKFNYMKDCIVLRPGPDVGGGDSSVYYNKFYGIDCVSSLRGIHFKKSTDSGSDGSGSNRNMFYATTINGTSEGNTGVQIDSGDTNTFFGLTLENLYSGTSPNTNPTGIIVEDNTAPGQYNINNMFLGVQFEQVTRHIANNNATTVIVSGQEFDNTIYSTPIDGASKNPSIMITKNLIRSADGPVSGNGLKAQVTSSLLLEGADTTESALIVSGSGVAANTNGVSINANTKIDGGQGDASLPSWKVDVGGENSSISNSQDTFGVYRRAAGSGTWSPKFRMYNTNAVSINDAYNIQNGTGTPEGVVTANVGSIFIRTDGGAGTTFYVKESGSGNTGWVGK